jgi:hypothetical protein
MVRHPICLLDPFFFWHSCVCVTMQVRWVHITRFRPTLNGPSTRGPHILSRGPSAWSLATPTSHLRSARHVTRGNPLRARRFRQTLASIHFSPHIRTLTTKKPVIIVIVIIIIIFVVVVVIIIDIFIFREWDWDGGWTDGWRRRWRALCSSEVQWAYGSVAGVSRTRKPLAGVRGGTVHPQGVCGDCEEG